jgi:hypothetical protein
MPKESKSRTSLSTRFSGPFNSAVRDYLFMLESHYPQKAILKLVGDRYALSGVERTLLYRGICTSTSANKRLKNQRIAPLNARSILHIDTYNVVLTIGSYLNGSRVFIAVDGFLRDASEIHGKAFRRELFDRSLLLMLDYLKAYKVKNVFFYLDRPVSHSGATAARINVLLEHYGFKGSATVHDSVDFILKRVEKGICVTSDSAIIDNALVPVYDLARKILEYHFAPKYYDLSVILKGKA